MVQWAAEVASCGDALAGADTWDSCVDDEQPGQKCLHLLFQ